jgi:hypothetical protein
MSWMKPGSHSFTQLSIFLKVPAKSGAYALNNFTRCIYLGESANLRIHCSTTFAATILG